MSFTETIPGTLATFKMIQIPDGETIKNLAVAETETTWDVFDIWAFRLDQTQQEIGAGVDAESRPSRPYGAPDKGFGHAGFAALGITFHAAQEFCQWLSQKTGKRYRLPTEEEWEYAARAGQKDDPTNLDEVAWFWDNADDEAKAVKRKKPNAWGIYDMLGNMAEWTIDQNGNPVVCGGSFMDKDDKVGFKARAYQTIEWQERDPQRPKSKWWLSDAIFVGFRVVCDL